MKIKFTKDYPATAEDFFQAEVKCTVEQMENLIGFPLVVEMGSDTKDYEFRGCALIDERRPVPFIVHNWKPNHSDNPPEFVWHIRTTFYQDGKDIKRFFESILHPIEQ